MKKLISVFLLVISQFFLPLHAQQFSDETIAIDWSTMEAPVSSQGGILSGVMASPAHHSIAMADFSSASSSMMMRRLFTPAMIMRNQSKLKLTDKQSEAIKKQMRNFQSNIVDVQWDLNSSSSLLNQSLGAEKINTKSAMKQIDRVLSAENKLKRMHLSLLIEIHNILDKNQIKILRNNLHPHFIGLNAGPVGDLLINEELIEEAQ